MHSHSHSNTPRLRRFAVTVDGVRHEVVVEELDATGPTPTGGATIPETGPGGQAAVPVGGGAAPAGTTGATDANGALDDGWIVAPMPGTVTEVAVNVGDTVNSGDVIVILTAMKLENEIVAPATGVVQAIEVSEADNVNSDDRLVQLSVEGDS